MDIFKTVLLVILGSALVILIFFVYLLSAGQTNEMVESETNTKYDYNIGPVMPYYGYYPYYFGGTWQMYPYVYVYPVQ